MNDSLNLKGHVMCYENGKLKWEADNKITYLGRCAMLATLARKNDILYEGNSYFKYSNAKWKAHPESWISCFALGNGADINESGLPVASSFTDTVLNRIIPFNEIKNIHDSALINAFEYIRLPESTELEINRDYCLDRGVNIVGGDVANPDEYVYFKTCNCVSAITKTEVSSNDSKRFGAEKLNANLVVAMYELNISEQDILRNSSKYNSINELSLYIANVETTNRKEMSKFKNVSDDVFSLPIQFSHITFPTETFTEGDFKTLNFKYLIYA